MDGLTGLDVSRAANDINNFLNSASAALSEINNCFCNLYVYLNSHWASNNAVEFTTENSEQINEMNREMSTTIDHIYNGAIAAAETLARANGATFPLISENIAGQTSRMGGSCSPCQENLNGVVGMDVAGIKVALNTFKNSIFSAIDKLDSVPDGIAFYDPNGAMISSYNRGVSSFKEKYSELARTTHNGIVNYISVEADNILIAKSNAVDSMSA